MEISLAINLKRLLMERGQSASSLSRETGVPATTLSNWLAGRPPKNITQLNIVANHLEVSIEELVFGIRLKTKTPLEAYEKEIKAGIYEVILRKVK